MAIATNDELLTLLGVTGTISAAHQALLTLVFSKAERLVKDHVGYNIEQATHTEFYPQRDQADDFNLLIDGYEMVGGRAVPYGGSHVNRMLTLRELPVRSITSIYENPSAWETDGGDWPASTLLTSGPDYMVDWKKAGLSWSGVVFRRSGAWTESPRAIKVTYVAGLTADELANEYGEFKHAVWLTIIKAFNTFKASQGLAQNAGNVGPVLSESLADWSVSYLADAVARMTGQMTALPREALVALEKRVGVAQFLPL